MRTLKIVDFDGHHLGTLTQSKNGKLDLQVIDERFDTDLKALLQRIVSKPVNLTTGERIEAEGKVSFVTRRKRVRPTDSDFLAGVKEVLNKAHFGKTRIRGLLLREESGDGR